jgi:hypothetical protein
MRTTTAAASLALAAWLVAPAARAEIRRDPNGVNVNASGATSVFITFGGLADQVPAEALWCGELIPADPDVGFKCDPGTIFGRLPIRYDRSRLGGAGSVFTDIMSIPPSVSRRAYQAAQRGEVSSFFYVRRFVSQTGGPDEYVFVTCRLAGGGARVPFSLLDVRLGYENDESILSVPVGQEPAAFAADISYAGTGRLRGRWEVVFPGEEPPTARDLLTEASLPPAERGTQRRYAQLDRFNAFLPPTGRYRLRGPDPSRLPTDVEGLYLVLLRIEASDDKEGDSNLANAGAGTGVVHSGAVAGFPMPVLRYYVGSAEAAPRLSSGEPLQQLLPLPDARVDPAWTVVFSWLEGTPASLYRLEVRDAAGEEVLQAVLQPGVGSYRAPSWLGGEAAGTALEWRVVALGPGGEPIDQTAWRRFRLDSE